MARLQSIQLKVSRSTAEVLTRELEGTNSNTGAKYKIKEGEIVLRLGEEGPEIWTLGSDGKASNIKADIAGQVPDWDPEDLDKGKLEQLSNVDLEDGNSGGIGPTQAGYVLTWDGFKWVARNQAGFEFDGIIPKLDSIGDVDYAFHGGGRVETPFQGDVLVWSRKQVGYQSGQPIYEENWGPRELYFADIYGMDSRRRNYYGGGRIFIDPLQYSELVFGKLTGNQNEEAKKPFIGVRGGKLAIGYGNTQLRIDNQAADLTVVRELTIRGTDQSVFFLRAHIQSVRFTRTRARYRDGDFTPPTDRFERPDPIPGQFPFDQVFTVHSGEIEGGGPALPDQFNALIRVETHPIFLTDVVAQVEFGGASNGVTQFSDESARDSSVALNNEAEATQQQFLWPFEPSSVTLDGTADSVTIGPNSDLETGFGEFTLEGWVRLESYSSVVDGAGIFALTETPGGPAALAVVIKGYDFGIYTAHDGNLQLFGGPTKINEDGEVEQDRDIFQKWIHIALERIETFDAQNIRTLRYKLWVNGEKLETERIDDVALVNINYLDIGVYTAAEGIASSIRGIRIDPQFARTEVYDESYLPSLAQVRADWKNRSINDLGDVQVAGATQGQALTYDVALERWIPSSGVAADLTQSSLDDVGDVYTYDKLPRQPLAWRPDLNNWVPTYQTTNDAKWDYKSQFPGRNADAAAPGYGGDYYCKPCDEDNLGRITVVDNLPYICLRSTNQSDINSKGRRGYSYQRILMDGLAPNPAIGNSLLAEKDPLSLVAYTGSLGSLSNVSTANLLDGLSLIYDLNTQAFKFGFPRLDLSAIPLGALADVNTLGTSDGFGLFWSTERGQWEAGSPDQKVRLNDLVDVQFGSTGVLNNKLVFAAILLPSSVEGIDDFSFGALEDVSPALSVSTPKPEGFGGTVGYGFSPDGHFYGYARQFQWPPNFTFAQKAAHYIYWENEPSWMQLAGDCTVELFFFTGTQIADQALIRQVATTSDEGGWLLKIKSDGALQLTVAAPQGLVGAVITTLNNTVSINNWHHVAIVKKGQQLKLYYDSNLVGESFCSAPLQGDGPMVLGRNDIDPSNTFAWDQFFGFMQDFRVYRGRAKYDGESGVTIPGSLYSEIRDTTPNPGDFMSYDGEKWVNVSGVQADITGNTISELADVDTLTQNPVTGSALVWTGQKWEPGIPGVGSAWTLDNFSDVSTNYSSNARSISLDQAETMSFSQARRWGDHDARIVAPSGNQFASYIGIDHQDQSWTCANGGDPGALYKDASNTYFVAAAQGFAHMRGDKIIIENVFQDCEKPNSKIWLEAPFVYRAVPGSTNSGHEGSGNPLGGDPAVTPDYFDEVDGQVVSVTPEIIPCWGNIQTHIYDILRFAHLNDIGNVSKVAPTNKQVLAWNNVDEIWEPSSDVAADISNNDIGDLFNVDETDKFDGSVLVYDATTQKWLPASRLGSIFQTSDVRAEDMDNGTPVDATMLREQFNQEYSLVGGEINERKLVDFAYSGITGIQFKGVGNSVGSVKASLYVAKSEWGSTILTSPSGGSSQDMSWLEVTKFGIHTRGLGGSSGGQGFRMGPGWKFNYEQSGLDWGDFEAKEVPHKDAIQDWVLTGLANLDLTLNDLEDLGNVNTDGVTPGYTLIWDGAQWIASAAAAADLSLSSIGDLADVHYTQNTDSENNDGEIEFEVGAITTSRPHQPGGGPELRRRGVSGNLIPSTRFGWSDSVAGAPIVQNSGAYLRVEDDRVTVGGVGQGIRYESEPALDDSTVPSFNQVRREIVRTLVDNYALFMLDGTSFTEKAYGWPLQVSVNSVPNPVLDSAFAFETSIKFEKGSYDRIVWQEGCPTEWSFAQPFAFEFLILVDSQVAGDGDEEWILAPNNDGDPGLPTLASNMLGMSLRGGRRDILDVVIGSTSENILSGPTMTVFLNLDSWNHVYFANEGNGVLRLFINGQIASELTLNNGTTGRMNVPHGFAFGGVIRSNALQQRGYLTAKIDDFRITKGWLPYQRELPAVPIPTQPLKTSTVDKLFGRISQLSDVNTVTTPPINGQVLKWNSIEEKWLPGDMPAPADLSQTSIDSLMDVQTTNAVADDKDILSFDINQQGWKRTKIDGNGGVAPRVARTTLAGFEPDAGMLSAGELFLNMADRRLYALGDDGLPFSFAQGEFSRIDAGQF